MVVSWLRFFWERKMSRYVRMTNLGRATAICVITAFLIVPGSHAVAQQPSPKTSTIMLCKISPSSKGTVLVTLSNLTTTTIPKGQMLFAKKGNKTIKFRTEKSIPNDGFMTSLTSAKEFEVEGDCEGWY